MLFANRRGIAADSCVHLCVCCLRLCTPAIRRTLAEIKQHKNHSLSFCRNALFCQTMAAIRTPDALAGRGGYSFSVRLFGLLVFIWFGFYTVRACVHAQMIRWIIEVVSFGGAKRAIRLKFSRCALFSTHGGRRLNRPNVISLLHERWIPLRKSWSWVLRLCAATLCVYAI